MSDTISVMENTLEPKFTINGREIPLARLNEEKTVLRAKNIELVEVAPFTFKTRLKD
jgi:hypothetical protein